VLNAKAVGEKNLTMIPVYTGHNSMMSQDAPDEMNVTKYMG